MTEAKGPLQIEYTQRKDGTWNADMHILPGTPPIGHGYTREDALENLICRLIQSHSGTKNPQSWAKYFARIRSAVNTWVEAYVAKIENRQQYPHAEADWNPVE